MGAYCAKQQPPPKERSKRSKGKTLIRHMSRAKSTVRRMSRVVGIAAAPLDPACNVCEIFTGQWKEFLNPDKEARITAMRLPYMVKKMMLKANVTMGFETNPGGVTLIMNFGFAKDTSKLEFNVAKKMETRILGLAICMETVAKRGRGGSLQYKTTQKQGAHTSVTSSEFTPEVKGDGCYMKDETLMMWGAEAAQKFTCTWKRTGAATAIDRSLFANYERLRADEAADHPPAEPGGAALVEMGLAEDAPE